MSTMNELIAQYNELAAIAGKPTRKGFDNKTEALAAITALQPAEVVIEKNVEQKPEQSKRGRKSGAAIKIMAAEVTKTAGPRGFKFGPVWTKAVREVSGIALREGNFAKLLAHATMLSVSVPVEATQEEVAKAVSAKLAA